MPRNSRLAVCIAAAASVAFLLSACSSSGDGGEATVSSTGGDTVADLDAANAYIAEYDRSRDKELLVTEPLEEGVPDGARIAFLDIGISTYTVMWEMLQEAAEAAGVEVERVMVGSDAQSINAGMNTVVETAPDAVINVGVDPTFFQTQFEQLNDAGIPMITSSIINAADFGIENQYAGADFSVETGRLLASTAISRTNGEATEFVIYTVPELAFSAPLLEGAQEQLATLCPDCTLRTVEVPIAEVGTTGPDRVVSDLQSNPQTQYFMVGDDQLQKGLPQKMSVAGIEVGGVGQAPTEVNFQQLLEGTQDATVAVDLNLIIWTLLDQALREINGQSYEVPDSLTVASTLQTVLTSDDITEDDAAGYVAIPDFREQFEALWTGN